MGISGDAWVLLLPRCTDDTSRVIPIRTVNVHINCHLYHHVVLHCGRPRFTFSWFLQNQLVRRTGSCTEARGVLSERTENIQ